MCFGTFFDLLRYKRNLFLNTLMHGAKSLLFMLKCVGLFYVDVTLSCGVIVGDALLSSTKKKGWGYSHGNSGRLNL